MAHSKSPSFNDLTPQQLVSEIRQISEQYQKEIGTVRRIWPASIRERVLAFHRLGVKVFQISKLCGIPEATTAYWCHPKVRAAQDEKRRLRADRQAVVRNKGRFLLPVPYVKAIPLPPTVGPNGAQIPAPQISGVLTLALPGGFEVRGIATPAQLMALYRELQS